MLAYLFFHEATSVDSAAYEQGLRDFHAALAEAGLPGFLGSRTYRVGGRYCDWYLVETSAALDSLNRAAVTGSRSRPHTSVAEHATNFAGKLVSLAAGDYDPDAGFEVRFAKPAGMSYDALYRMLEEWTSRPDVSLWRRMMVLGPPPEFFLLMPAGDKLPAELGGEMLSREPV